MSCESAMKRVKREIDDYYGEGVKGSPKAGVAAATAASTRGRSESRKPRIATNATVAKRAESRARLIAKGIEKPTAPQIAKEMSAIDRAKLSPTSGALNADRVKYEGIYRKTTEALKAMSEGKTLPKSEEGKTKEQLESEKAAAKIAYQAAKKGLIERTKAKNIVGGSRRSRRMSYRKQRKSRRMSYRKQRKSRRMSMRH